MQIYQKTLGKYTMVGHIKTSTKREELEHIKATRVIVGFVVSAVSKRANKELFHCNHSKSVSCSPCLMLKQFLWRSECSSEYVPSHSVLCVTAAGAVAAKKWAPTVPLS
ncbi:hypothetical protein TNIN_229911 [Trichonephila inaurata madagascariensis]|uniref:Uncharacterized protein n=1 Tax=Trichonephila inaurata madagascariensis TaxID=2747483 RepID=A0A8X7C0T0_9ARAC|nr:hypothetical protein TNIN_229911 [Trichonephila inaurata madagascariensis]